MSYEPKRMEFVERGAQKRHAETEWRGAQKGRIERMCDRIDGQRGRVAIPKIICIGVVLWLAVLGGSVALHWFADWINSTAALMQPKEATP